jgi:hypothetical protein
LSGFPLSRDVSGQRRDRPAKDRLPDKQSENAMARRGLLNDADRQRLFGVPDDNGSLIRLYSLGEADQDFIPVEARRP